MKTAKHHHSVLTSYRKWQVPFFALFGLLAANSLLADNLTWAPNTTGASDGSGNWLDGNVWWNGSSIVSGAWTGATPDGAIFGNGTAGTYAVDLGGNNVFVTNLVFNTSGYTLQNGSLTQWGYGASGKTIITVGANVSAAIATVFTNANSGGGNSTISVGSGGVLTFSGGASFNGNLVNTGAGAVDFQSGTYGGPNFVLWSQGNVNQEAATLNVNRLLIGYAGNSTYTINSASALVNNTGGGGNTVIGRGGSSGVLKLQQGTVHMNSGSAANNGIILGNDGGSKGTLTVEGGSLNLGSGSSLGNIQVNAGATSATGAGTFNLSGGTVKANGVTIGGGGTYTSGSTAAVNVTGGSLYLGSGGFANNYGGSLTANVTLSGGTIGALANWSSSVNATLGTINGNIAFKAADDAGTAHDITWNGVLSGAGGLINTGAGTFTLGGLNSYTGNTTVNGNLVLASAGQLSFEIGVNGANNQVDGTGALTLDGTLNFDLSGAGTTSGDTWVILDTASGLVVTYGSGFTVNGFTQNGNLWTSGNYQYDEANNKLSYIVPVPEPASTAILAGGLAMFLAFYRSRR